MTPRRPQRCDAAGRRGQRAARAGGRDASRRVEAGAAAPRRRPVPTPVPPRTPPRRRRAARSAAAPPAASRRRAEPPARASGSPPPIADAVDRAPRPAPAATHRHVPTTASDAVPARRAPAAHAPRRRRCAARRRRHVDRAARHAGAWRPSRRPAASPDRSSQRPPTPTEVHVHIGRIEVTAVHERAGAAPQGRAAPAPRCRSTSTCAARRRPPMSTALAIAGVTAVLRDLLNDGLINHNVSGVLGSSVTVSALPPDRVVPAERHARPQLNLFLLPGHAQHRLAQRRPALARRVGARAPEQPAAGARPALPAVGLQRGDLHAEILLGYAMQLLHETPVLTREAIRTALDPVARRPAPPAARAARARRVRASPTRSSRSRSRRSTSTPRRCRKLWTAMQSHYRPTAAYKVSVVLIEARQPARVAAAGAQPRPGRSGDRPRPRRRRRAEPRCRRCRRSTRPSRRTRSRSPRIGDTVDLQRPSPRRHRPRGAAAQRPLRDRRRRSPASPPPAPPAPMR